MPVLILLTLLILIYLYLILPRYNHQEAWKSLSDYRYAHRGLHNELAPENTLAAFQLAIDHGYGFELDVQRTKDNILVVLHDHNLKRTCGLDKEINELTYDQIKELKVFNSDQHIPLFEEVLTLVSGKVPMIIEIKQNSKDPTTCELTAKYLDNYQGAFCIESFHPYAVKWFKEYRPEWIRGQLAADFSKDDTKSIFLSFVLENLLLNFMTRPDFVAYEVDDKDMFSFKFYRKILKGGSALWTIRDPHTYQSVKDQHDTVIFENFII